MIWGLRISKVTFICGRDQAALKDQTALNCGTFRIKESGQILPATDEKHRKRFLVPASLSLYVVALHMPGCNDQLFQCV